MSFAEHFKNQFNRALHRVSVEKYVAAALQRLAEVPTIESVTPGWVAPNLDETLPTLTDVIPPIPDNVINIQMKPTISAVHRTKPKVSFRSFEALGDHLGLTTQAPAAAPQEDSTPNIDSVDFVSADGRRLRLNDIHYAVTELLNKVEETQNPSAIMPYVVWLPVEDREFCFETAQTYLSSINGSHHDVEAGRDEALQDLISVFERHPLSEEAYFHPFVTAVEEVALHH